MSRCLNREWYPNVSDSEFWSRILTQEGFPDNDDEPDYGDYEDWDRQVIKEWGLMPPVPCPECSQTDACGYDDNGCPWIHLVIDHDEGS